MMMKIPDLRSRIQRRTNNVYDTLFVRRLSVFFTAALAPAGVTANQVSLFGIFVALVSCLLIAFGTPRLIIAGIVLVHLYAILDSVDGEIARLTRTFTLKGLFLEDLSAFYMIVGFPIAVAMHIHHAGIMTWPLALAIGFGAFGRNGIAAARRAVIKSISTRRPASPGLSASGSLYTSLRRLVEDQLLNHTNIRLVVSTSLAIEVIVGAPPRITSWLLGAILIGLIAREAAVILRFLRGSALDAFLWQVYADAKVVNTDSSAADGLQLAGN
jgi:phosphatidylglycerophosphate synthase